MQVRGDAVPMDKSWGANTCFWFPRSVFLVLSGIVVSIYHTTGISYLLVVLVCSVVCMHGLAIHWDPVPNMTSVV